MDKIRAILWHAGIEYRKFLNLKNVMIMIFSIVFLLENVVFKMAEISEETGLSMHFLEPMNLILENSMHSMTIPVIFVVLLSGFPDKSADGVFMMIRTGRSIWLIGELIYAVMAGLTYILIMTVLSMLSILHCGAFFSDWSLYMTMMSSNFPDVYNTNFNFFLSSGTVMHGHPIGVYIISVIMMLFYLIFMAQSLCVFKMTGFKRFGIYFCIVISILGACAISYIPGIEWYLPLSHAVFGIHYDSYYSEPIFPLIGSVLYFIILNSVLFLINGYLAKRCMIGDDKT